MISDTRVLPINRGLASEIVTRLTTAILSGQLGPGERLREEELADALGVSRGPLREAFTQLERQGLVVLHRNRGAYVARLSCEDVDEVYSLRLALEPLAMQRAMQFVTTDQLAELQVIVDRMATYGTGMTEQEAAQDDLMFHDVIYQASKHQRLYECWTNLRPQIHIMLLTRNVANPDFRYYAPRGHTELLDVLKSKDEAHAIAVVQEHLRIAYDRVLSSYPSQKTRD
ncbi:MAG: GntR family transcriptional regulator [Herpetosiphonaceae bacterium]|nr:GntR family transcriptional regulator [Herpetosiphonaceae bacterium]